MRIAFFRVPSGEDSRRNQSASRHELVSFKQKKREDFSSRFFCFRPGFLEAQRNIPVV
jgi:hypothetical protein